MDCLEQTVANNLTELRKKKNWTQAELATRINYSDKTVSKWGRGEALPDLRVLKQMSELFEVDLEYFITEHEAIEQIGFAFPRRSACLHIVIVLLAASVLCLIIATIAALLVKYVM